MIQVSDFDLLAGQPFRISSIGTFRAPKISDLFSVSGIGLDKYNMMLSLFSMGAEDLIHGIGLDEKYAELSPSEKEQFTPFFMITTVPGYRELLLEALDFFMLETVSFDETTHTVALISEDGSICGTVCNDNYDDLRAVVMKSSCLSMDYLSMPKKFRSKKAKSIFEKIEASRHKKATAKPDDSLSLWNVISSVSARHNSYNLLNIWDLTIYQLYDQFSKLNLNHQIDVGALRWAAWGQNSFDFSLWYKHEN